MGSEEAEVLNAEEEKMMGLMEKKKVGTVLYGCHVAGRGFIELKCTYVRSEVGREKRREGLRNAGSWIRTSAQEEEEEMKRIVVLVGITLASLLHC